jgi:DNA-directed RNA polymerase subunit E'/Rpb7
MDYRTNRHIATHPDTFLAATYKQIKPYFKKATENKLSKKCKISVVVLLKTNTHKKRV